MHHYTIKDRKAVESLENLGDENIKNYGGEILIASPMKAHHGSAEQHMMVIKFSSVTAAEKFRNSDGHKEFMKTWSKATNGWDAIVPDVAGTEQFVQENGLS